MQQGDKIRSVIVNMNNEGEGIIRFANDGFVLFVPNAITGEEVTCRVVKKKRKYGIAKVLERHSNADERTEPFCPHFGKCGGCQLQHMAYHAQLSLKTKTLRDALERIGGLKNPPVASCEPSPKKIAYRNKASLPVQSRAMRRFIAGFYKPRSHNIVPLKTCPVLMQEVENTLKYMIDKLAENNFYGKPYTGNANVTEFIRHIVIRAAENTDDILSAVVGNFDVTDRNRKMFEIIAENAVLPLSGLIYNKNRSSGNFIWGDVFTALYGAPVMEEKLADYKFRFEASSFFQVNSGQALKLYKKAAELASGEGDCNILELYSGTGSLTAFLAAQSKTVTAVESWLPAAKYIEPNARLNGFNNVEVFKARAEDIADSLSHKKFDTVVVDPPRSGCATEVIRAILKIRPQKIVYVSCAPATLARDIKALTAGNYILSTAQPFDMFPQTGHIETVVLMSRVKDK